MRLSHICLDTSKDWQTVSLRKGRSVNFHLKFGTTYPLTSNFPRPSQPLNHTYLNSFRNSLLSSTPLSDCLSLRFSHVLISCALQIFILLLLLSTTKETDSGNGKWSATTTTTHVEMYWWHYDKDIKGTQHSNNDWEQRPMVKIRG